MNNLKNLRGTTDLLPEQLKKWQNVENIIKEQLLRAHVKEIRTPILEMTEPFVRGIGENNYANLGTDDYTDAVNTIVDCTNWNNSTEKNLGYTDVLSIYLESEEWAAF